ncbi:MAG: hypothetical protein IJV70_07695 [Clostridia bacterium]|nr:hypothetical protein [Clostridia bacterium]
MHRLKNRNLPAVQNSAGRLFLFKATSLLMVVFLYFSNIDLSDRKIIYLVKISLFVVGEGLAIPEKSP